MDLIDDSVFGTSDGGNHANLLDTFQKKLTDYEAKNIN